MSTSAHVGAVKSEIHYEGWIAESAPLTRQATVTYGDLDFTWKIAEKHLWDLLAPKIAPGTVPRWHDRRANRVTPIHGKALRLYWTGERRSRRRPPGIPGRTT
jgi:hypothetical protein